MVDTPAVDTPVEPERVGLSAAGLAAADDALRALLAQGEVTAAGLAVRRRGRLAHARVLGVARRGEGIPATARTLFAVASITKPVAATATMLLIERGHLDLDTPVVTLLPDFGQQGKEGVTVAHLLTHTSGLDEAWIEAGAAPGESRAAYLARVYAAPLRWAPGTRVAYCNAGFSLLGPLLDHAGGVPHARFLAEALFAPLGMRDTFFDPPAAHHPRIAACPRPNGRDVVPALLAGGTLAGGLLSTAVDLTRFGQFFLDEGRAPDGHPMLTPEGVGAMLADRTGGLPPGPAPDAAPGTGLRVGLGWMVAAPGRPLLPGLRASARAFGHGGSSGAYLGVDPNYDLVVGLVANCWRHGAMAGEIAVLDAVWAAAGVT